MTDAPHDLVANLVSQLNKHATSEDAWLQGDEVSSLWGVPIPYLAFAYVNGGCSVLPCQRYIGVSGEEKSMKSTLMVEFGNWYIQAGGVHVHLDSENKLNKGAQGTTVDALSWWNGVADRRCRVVKTVASVGEWQDQATAVVEHNRSIEQPTGRRMPVLVTVDSLTGRSTAAADEDLRKDGHAVERGYPVAANQVTNYLEALNLLGTTCTLSWVQHMKQVIDGGGAPGYGGPEWKEKGAKASQFACSLHLRVRAAKSAIRVASHDSAPFPGTVEGHELWLNAARTCVGPGNRTISVELLWQHVRDESTGHRRQVMWFDWHGALGRLLSNMKYNDKFKPKQFTADKEALEEALSFTEVRKNCINCKELGLEKVSYYQFGKAIDDNIEVRDRVADFLGITDYPSVQDAEIDFRAGDLSSKKSKRGK